MTAVKPFALVVEDDNENREIRMSMLENEGFVAIGASSLNEALRELKACPSLDVVITDINLDIKNSFDTSGVDFAAKIKQFSPNLPVVGYSGQVKELDKGVIKLFDLLYLKGLSNPDQLIAHVKEWHERAVEYHSNKYSKALSELDRIKVKYNFTEQDYNVLREFIPGISNADETTSSVEDVLRNAGYELKIIESAPGSKVYSDFSLHYPLLIWVHKSDVVIVEVYGFSELYSHGNNEESAIQNLLFLMKGFYEDLKNSTDSTLSKNLQHMRNYLIKIFG